MRSCGTSWRTDFAYVTWGNIDGIGMSFRTKYKHKKAQMTEGHSTITVMHVFNHYFITRICKAIDSIVERCNLYCRFHICIRNGWSFLCISRITFCLWLRTFVQHKIKYTYRIIYVGNLELENRTLHFPYISIISNYKVICTTLY